MKVTPVSKPTKMTDEDGNLHTVQLVLSPDCSVNLLGRDLMTKFNIAIVPTDQGMRAIKMEQNNVVLGKGPPTRWWSLDLPEKTPAQIPKMLIEETAALTTTSGCVTLQNPNKCHCTAMIHHQCPNGRDNSPPWDLKGLIQYLYVSDNRQGGVSVSLPQEAKQLYSIEEPSIPHVSSSKLVGWCETNTLQINASKKK